MTNITLDTDVKYVKGVGPSWAQRLGELGVNNVGDLLTYFPFRFNLRRQAQPIESLVGDEDNATVAGEVITVKEHRYGKRPFLQAQLQDDTGWVFLKWFNSGYLRDRLKPGMRIAANAKVSTYRESLQMVNPRFQIIWDPDGTDLSQDELMPVYPAGKKLTSPMIASVIKKVLPEARTLIPRWFDPEYLEKRGMLSRPVAVEAMHRPEDREHWGQARRRLAYDECLLMQLGMAMMRMRQRTRPAHELVNTPLIDERIRARFPFTLTDGQDGAIEEICNDLAQTRPMNRLLQGDVGSGKTVVALYAALLATARGKQTAIMAPTEILANQHFAKVTAYLAGSRVRLALLVGKQKAAERKQIMQQLADGEIDIVVGTHALISEGVQFSDLALVVVDEQHKFGVAQRTGFRGKGYAPHYLVMTATPIPRTLSMTVFGDLDVSVIKSLPPGRGKTTTQLMRLDQHAEMIEIVRKHVAGGQQAYFIYPLVSASDQLDLTAAEDAFTELSKEHFPDVEVAIVHGQMKPAEKADAMARFRSGQARILVASVVVEVGVDVPSANVMVINHAERFGLAQLHQLRGRVGRSTSDALCMLMANAVTLTARDRMQVLVETNDGFKVAEEDLRIRGPGEIFGTQQHGLPELKVADLIEDFELLRLARRDAFAMIAEDPGLNAPHHQQLRTELIRAYSGKFDFLAGA